MTISNNKVVTLIYELHAGSQEGELIEKAEAEDPFVFLFGSGDLLEKFEANLKGKQVGDKFEFSIGKADAYGDSDPANVIEFPKSNFTSEENGEDLLAVGNVLDLEDEQGDVFQGKVTELSGENVKLDFNHSMAGLNLYFSVEVTGVRDATAEEAEHGHVHDPGGKG